MSRYQKLRGAFAAYKESEKKFCDENVLLATLIVNGLRDFLEMPRNFQSNGETKSYTPFYNLDEEENTSEVPFLQNALTHVSDGSFRFGLGVILEKAEVEFPKHNLIIIIRCARKGNEAHFTILDKELDCDFDGAICPDVEKVHALIYRLVSEWLKQRPGDHDSQTKIGFKLENRVVE